MTTIPHDTAPDPAADQLAAALRELAAVYALPFPAHGEPGHHELMDRIRATESDVYHAAAGIVPCPCPDRLATNALGLAGEAIAVGLGYLAVVGNPDAWEAHSPFMFDALARIPDAIAALNPSEAPE